MSSDNRSGRGIFFLTPTVYIIDNLASQSVDWWLLNQSLDWYLQNWTRLLPTTT